jgi:cell division septal protein FtsQ
MVEEKTDYSPVVEETGDAEKRRERRKWGAFLAGAHLFWVYALILGVILAILYIVSASSPWPRPRRTARRPRAPRGGSTPSPPG